jgi:hypothetical protein
MLEIKIKGGVDIDDVNAKQGKNNFELTEIVVERISVKTQKLSIKTFGKRCNSKNSQFPSIIKLFKSKSDLENCNLLLKDYNEYDATKY